MDGTSFNITQDLIQKLKEIVPQAFTEDKIDISRLQTILGDSFTTDAERYGLSWAGKSEAYKVLQSPSTATLIPNPEQSIDWDNAENIFIEGENLEVLKVLQKSYYGKVKMIYIDPPYNTGSDSFIYPDKFSETKEEYLKRIGDKDDDGFMMKEGLYRKNNKENGQFHSNWLNMMLPRLFLARNLLKDDGIFFIQIDDNEQANLKILMDEIFGEENFINSICVKMSHLSGVKMSHKDKKIPKLKEYILIYAKNKEQIKINPIYVAGKWEDVLDRYNYFVDKSESDCKDWRVYNLNLYMKENEIKSENEIEKFKIQNAENIFRTATNDSFKDIPVHEYFEKISTKTGLEKYIYKGEEVLFASTKIRQIDGESVPADVIGDIWTDIGINNLHKEGEVSFENGKKPIRLIKRLINLCTNEEQDSIILDFFSGSGTTQQATLEANEDDGGCRKFIGVQLPEKTEDNSEARKSGFTKISEITLLRIKKAIERIKRSRDGKLEFETYQNLGFRKYTLASSNFKIWRGDVVENEEDLIKQMQLFTTPQKENTQSENILWELLIKNGVPLTEKIECSTLQDGAKIYYTANKKLAFVLDSYTDEVQTAVLALKPKNIICLDSLFHNNDNVKTNAQLKFEDNGISFKTI